jgi:dienelactone hydrolase
MLQSHATLTLPEGEGPFPVVILMHGCGGRRPQMMENYARAANEAGAAALIVDSWSPRGIGRLGAVTTICTGARLRGRERAGDLYAMTDWARQQSWADPERIIAAGWSHGAWAVMDALALHSGEEMRRATHLEDLPDEPLAGLAGAFLVYPYVGPPAIAGRRAWRLQPQTSAINGGRDLIVGTKSPTRALERQIEHGAPIQIH